MKNNLDPKEKEESGVGEFPLDMGPFISPDIIEREGFEKGKAEEPEEEVEDKLKEEEEENLEPPEKKKRGRPPKKKEEAEEEIEDDLGGKKRNREELEEELDETISKNKSKDKEEASDEETEQVGLFVDLLNDELGWELKDNERPKNIEEFVDFIQEIIETNSKPKYQSELVEQFDTYVKQGGDPRVFLEVNYMIPDYDKIDISKEENQIRIVRDYYRMKQFKEEKIERLISNLKKDEELEDEAKSAQEELTEMTMKQKKALIDRQQAIADAQEESFRKAINDTRTFIEKSKDVYGIPITAKEKTELMPYIFKKDADGKTQLQKEYQESPVEFTVTTAFLWKNREKLMNLINNESTTKGTQRFRERLKEINQKGKSKADRGSVADEEPEDFLTEFSRRIVKPN